jgi:hypothetical protein
MCVGCKINDEEWRMEKVQDIKHKEIIITKRANDFHAHLKGWRGVWGCGNSTATAVGSLITNHPGRFNIKFYNDDDKETLTG